MTPAPDLARSVRSLSACREARAVRTYAPALIGSGRSPSARRAARAVSPSACRSALAVRPARASKPPPGVENDRPGASWAVWTGGRCPFRPVSSSERRLSGSFLLGKSTGRRLVRTCRYVLLDLYYLSTGVLDRRIWTLSGVLDRRPRVFYRGVRPLKTPRNHSVMWKIHSNGSCIRHAAAAAGGHSAE